MCGIVGFAAKSDVIPSLFEGLSKLEYRGYDSAGIAFFANDKIDVVKSKGRLKNLKDKFDSERKIESQTGIGHTRWATHGEPNDANAHPHLSRSNRFAVVHNGIIENYIELKEKLIKKGYEFTSDTDTEVVAHLFEYYYKGDILDAFIKVQSKLEGSYALGVLSVDSPGEIIAARKDSPLVAGICEFGAMIASDVPALLSYTRDFYEIGEKEIVILTQNSLRFYDSEKEPLQKNSYHVDWDADAAELSGYEHFMMKEIMEQPRAIKDTISTKIKNGEAEFDGFSFADLGCVSRVYITACGSAYHAGIVGKHVIQRLTGLPAEAELASEFRYQDPILTPGTLAVVISQSGETADTIAALNYAKSKGVKTLAIVNVVGSAIAKAADFVIYTNAGPEIAVATTKAYSCQLIVLYLLGIYLARHMKLISDERNAELIKELSNLPEKVSEALLSKDLAQYLASRHFGAKDVFYIGRNLDYAAALEASLKLKEISYIHSEAYAAGELKHGTIALIEDGSLVIAVAVTKKMFEKLASNILELKARKAEVLALTWENNEKINAYCKSVIYVPVTLDLFTPTLTIIPLQLFAYYIASLKGLDIDKPRNLAKSVTVE
jgi:glucosamine--fructose-6-phosphate aminotransferase (isomerizing)